MSEYDDIRGHSEPDLAAQSRFFESYIAPLLKDSTNPGHLNPRYFYGQGWTAWRLSVDKNDLKSVKFVEWICEEMHKAHGADFEEIIAEILKNEYDASVRSEQGERNLHNSKVRGKNDQVVSDQLRLYKILFENGFKLYATIPYYYLCQVYKIPNQVSRPADYVDIGASEKLAALRSISLPPTQGDFKDLIRGFDNKIRNAGEGHDQWRILDNDSVELKITDPKTGRHKETIIRTEKELEEDTKTCRKTKWVLAMGLTIFLTNNPEVHEQVDKKKDYTRKEIQDYAEGFADNRWFEIKDLTIAEDRSTISMIVKYSPKIVVTGGQIFFGSAEAYDIVHKKIKVEYEYQMLDIVKYILNFFDKEKLPTITVEMLDEGEKNIGIVEYRPDELKKLFIEEGKIQIPVPATGEVPKKVCEIQVPLRVPYGTGPNLQKRIDNMDEQRD